MVDSLAKGAALTAETWADFVARLHAENERLAALVEAQQPAPLCTRSHPHEQMTWRCKVLSVVAELRNMEARGQGSTAHELGLLADLLDVALQPAPSAAVALSDDLRDRLVAISEAVADQDDRAAQAMIREILEAPQPSPTAPADSQPAHHWDTGYPTLPAPAGKIQFPTRPHESTWAPSMDAYDESQMRAYVDADRAARAPADSVLEDAARLDFLIEQRAYVVSDPDACPGYWLHFVHKETGKCWVQVDEHPSPRAAIDAARKQGGAA